jgi:DNA-binding PadR family transcriptional regulator
MERGALRSVLLDTLRDGPKHGYDMIKSVEERTQGEYAPSPGSLYPTLQYLEDLGQIRVQSEGDRKVYEITDAGLAELEAQADRVAAFWGRFGGASVSEPLRHERRFLEEELDDLGRTVWRGLSGAFDRGEVDLIRSARKAITDCREAIRGLIADG